MGQFDKESSHELLAKKTVDMSLATIRGMFELESQAAETSGSLYVFNSQGGFLDELTGSIYK